MQIGKWGASEVSSELEQRSQYSGRTAGQTALVSDPGRGQEILLSPNRLDRLGDPPSLLLNGRRGTFRGLTRPEYQVKHLSASSPKVKNEQGYNSTPLTGIHGVDRGKFNFTLCKQAFWVQSGFTCLKRETAASHKAQNCLTNSEVFSFSKIILNPFQSLSVIFK